MPKCRRPLRIRLFIASEGKSEIAFGAWLQGLCNGAGLHVHLDRPGRATGGDPLALVRNALELRQRSKEKTGTGHRHSFLLIDTDRLDDRSPRSIGAIELAERERLVLIRQNPCFEGLLLRLHRDHERHWPANPRDAEQRLCRLWPDYRKPPTRVQLAARFGHADLLRAATADPDLACLLKVIGLIKSEA